MEMKISGSGGPSKASSARGGQAAGPSGFGAMTRADEGAATTAASRTYSVSGVESLLALQAVETATERKRRAVRRAGGLLDVLDELKISLLDGRLDSNIVVRLKGRLAEARDATDDDGLEGILNEVETRAAVELAKSEMARAAFA